VVDRREHRRIGDETSVENGGRFVVLPAKSVGERHATSEAPPHRADTAGHVVPLPQKSRGGIEIGDHGVGVRQVF
ncbi:uncharacterized protein METZ01_LOCUS27727, partial [marine metagenome]